MTITELLSGPQDYATLHGLFIVGPPPFMQAILDAQQADAKHRLWPVLLTDGRYLLGADLLTEVAPGGLYHDAWEALPPGALDACKVMTKDEVQPLLPVIEMEEV